MGDREEAPPAWREYVLTAEQIEEIERRVAWERRARRRKAPSWSPDTDPPWRSLEHSFVAALKACRDISTRDLETILTRGEVPISGRRNDLVSDDMLPVRIEKLVAAAERRVFFLEINAIWAAYNEPVDRAMPRVGSLSIELNNVRIHWPILVTALQETGFAIGAKPQQGRSRGSPPKEVTQRIAAPARKRGRRPEIFNAVVAKMRVDLEARRLTPETLDAKREKELAADYQVSRDTARRARNTVSPRSRSSRR